MAGDDRVYINVGGTRFVTTSTTIANAGPDSMLATLLDENWRPIRAGGDSSGTFGGGGEMFIDRNPAYFAAILDLLRTGELRAAPPLCRRALLREALYYGVAAMARAAMWAAPLDGNRCTRAAQVSGAAAAVDDDSVSAIRASPSGGAAVAHGCMVHIYDWSLEELPPVNLDFMLVTDVGFVGNGYSPAAERLVICTQERGDEIGGMACFNPATGNLEHRFRLAIREEDEAGSSSRRISRNFTAVTLASGGGKIFTGVRSRAASGIAIWDQETGESRDFFTMDSCQSKLQWIDGLLLAASMYPQTDHCYLSLIDLRPPPNRSVVWEWTDAHRGGCSDVVMDAVAMHGGTAICLVNQYDNLGFLDTRSSTPLPPPRWSQRFKQLKLSELEEHSYSKLCANQDSSQIFSSRRHGDVLVYSCSSSWSAASPSDLFTRGIVPTARLASWRRGGGGGSGGGAVADMDIGGDRLFVLHSDENVFDVWETPIARGVLLP